jgi:hypothetical protein
MSSVNIKTDEHTDPHPQETTSEPSQSNTVQVKPSESKRPCLYYQKGKCVFGEHCDMLHEDVNRRRIPVCKYFLQNNCSYGENCLYRHEKENPKHKQSKGWRKY